MRNGIILILIALIMLVFDLILKEFEVKKDKVPFYMKIKKWKYYSFIVMLLILGLISIIF